MAVTPIYGIPYVESSDLVANYPAVSESLAEQVEEKLPTYAATAPTSPSVGQVWIDSDDNLGRVWTGSVWQLFSGAGNANFSDAATGTYTDSGIDYKYLTYTGSGTITFTTKGNATILVVAGGGGGGARIGGGGGAGGHLALSEAFFDAATYSVVVGAGAPSVVSSVGVGRQGSSSHAGPYGAPGGGGAGAFGKGAASFGGSGGGGAGLDNLTGGTAFLFQGNAGGNGNVSYAAGAGGGGAGAVGAVPTSSTVGGNGGNGASSSITGTAVTRAGGGGGCATSGTAGTGGSGGGGAGATGSSAGTNGTVNTGGGGGGARDVADAGNITAGAGGSGVVIIRVRTN